MRGLTVSLLFALALWAPAQARTCEPPPGRVVRALEADGTRVWRVGQGWYACTRGSEAHRFARVGVVRGAARRVSRVDIAGRYLAYREDHRESVRIVLVDAARGREVDSAQLWGSSRETIRTPALIAHRRGAAAYTVSGRRRAGVYLLERRSNVPLDRQAGIRLDSLTATAHGFRWLRAGRARRFVLGTPFGPPSRCSTPPAAESAERAGHSLVFSLTSGDDEASGGWIYGCVEGGPVHRLAEVSSIEFSGGTGAAVRAFNGPHVLLDRGSHSRYGGTDSLTSYDLRTGAVLVDVVAGDSGPDHSDDIRRAVLSRSGSIAWSNVDRYRTGGQEIVTRTIQVAEPGSARILDKGDDVDVDSLRLDGTTLTWTRGGTPRSAELP